MRLFKTLWVIVSAMLLTGCATGPMFTNDQTTLPQMNAVLGEPITSVTLDGGVTRYRWARESFHGVALDGTRVDNAVNFYDGEFSPNQVLRRWRAVDGSVSLRNELGFDLPTSQWATGYASRNWGFPRGSFLEICATGSPEQVQSSITRGADARQKDAQSQTPLMAAAAYNEDARVISVLLKAGSDVNARNASGATPLMIAAGENERVVPALIAAGAEVNLQNSAGQSALWSAARSSRNTAIRALLHAGANPNLADAQGRGPLMLACMLDNPDGAAALCEAGADANANCKEGTPLQLAVINGTGEPAISALIRSRANMDVKNARGQSVLDIARAKGSPQVIQLLVQAGAK